MHFLSSKRCSVIAALSLGALLVAAGAAHAARTQSASGVCGMVVNSGSGWGNVAGPWLLTRTASGISNPDIYAHDITCPVVRAPVTNGTRRMGIQVDGYPNSPITCTAYSYAYSGWLQASVAFTTVTTKTTDLSRVMPTGSIWDYVTLKCTIGPNNGAILRGLKFTEE
jgi:hypothetical protein